MVLCISLCGYLANEEDLSHSILSLLCSYSCVAFPSSWVIINWIENHSANNCIHNHWFSSDTILPLQVNIDHPGSSPCSYADSQGHCRHLTLHCHWTTLVAPTAPHCYQHWATERDSASSASLLFLSCARQARLRTPTHGYCSR